MNILKVAAFIAATSILPVSAEWVVHDDATMSNPVGTYLGKTVIAFVENEKISFLSFSSDCLDPETSSQNQINIFKVNDKKIRMTGSCKDGMFSRSPTNQTGHDFIINQLREGSDVDMGMFFSVEADGFEEAYQEANSTEIL